MLCLFYRFHSAQNAALNGIDLDPETGGAGGMRMGKGKGGRFDVDMDSSMDVDMGMGRNKQPYGGPIGYVLYVLVRIVHCYSRCHFGGFKWAYLFFACLKSWFNFSCFVLVATGTDQQQQEGSTRGAKSAQEAPQTVKLAF
jgi:hypothetical protein